MVAIGRRGPGNVLAGTVEQLRHDVVGTTVGAALGGRGRGRGRSRNVATLCSSRTCCIEIGSECSSSTAILMVRVVLRVSDDGIETLTSAGHSGGDGEGAVERDLGDAPASREHSGGSSGINAVGGVCSRSMHDVSVFPLVS